MQTYAEHVPIYWSLVARKDLEPFEPVQVVRKLDGCQNYGPFLVPYYSTAPHIWGAQRETIILTTPQLDMPLPSLHFTTLARESPACFSEVSAACPGFAQAP